MKSVTFDKSAASFVLGLIGVKNSLCHGCDKVVIPETFGGACMLSDGKTPGIFHDSLPCLLQMLSVMQAIERSER